MVNQRLGRLDGQACRGDRPCGRRSYRRQARRSFSAGGVADGIGHAVEHERQRGDLEPGDRNARRRDGLEEARAPQRPRQYEPVVERHLSDGHAHRRRRRGDKRRCCRRSTHLHAALDDKAEQCEGHRQDRPDPYAGRHAADARPGILRLRGGAEARQGTHREGARRRTTRWRREARPSARASMRRSASTAHSPAPSPRSPVCPSAPRRTSSRHSPRTARSTVFHGA